MVEATIDLAALEDHQFVIKPDFDDNLKAFRKRMDDLREEMDKEHIRVGHDLRQDTEKKLKLEQHHVYGWCLRLTRNVHSPSAPLVCDLIFPFFKNRFRVRGLTLCPGSGIDPWKEGIYRTFYTKGGSVFHNDGLA